MQSLKRLLAWSVLTIVVLIGFWMAIVNDSPIVLNLLFMETTPLNAGFVLFSSNLLGLLIGFITGFIVAKYGSWKKAKAPHEGAPHGVTTPSATTSVNPQ